MFISSFNQGWFDLFCWANIGILKLKSKLFLTIFFHKLLIHQINVSKTSTQKPLTFLKILLFLQRINKNDFS